MKLKFWWIVVFSPLNFFSLALVVGRSPRSSILFQKPPTIFFFIFLIKNKETKWPDGCHIYTTILKVMALIPNILLYHHTSPKSSLTLKSLSILGQETPHNHWTPGWLIQTWNLNSLLLRNVTKTIFYCTVPMENQHHTSNKPTQTIFGFSKASQPVWKIIQMLCCILLLQRF